MKLCTKITRGSSLKLLKVKNGGCKLFHLTFASSTNEPDIYFHCNDDGGKEREKVALSRFLKRKTFSLFKLITESFSFNFHFSFFFVVNNRNC